MVARAQRLMVAIIDELVVAKRVIVKDFETKDLFQACQPIEEIARKGIDAPRFGTMKPVGLTDPSTGRRPWAALQLRREDASGQSYNLVGFQTNLTFGEQKRVFRMIPGPINVAAMLESKGDFIPPKETVFGALLDYATSKDTIDYQPMHVNFGIIAPLEESIKKKQLRYAKYQQRGAEALTAYVAKLKEAGLHPCKDTP